MAYKIQKVCKISEVTREGNYIRTAGFGCVRGDGKGSAAPACDDHAAPCSIKEKNYIGWEKGRGV
jgi:hypothetical protein